MLSHVCVETTEQVRRSIAFLGHNSVDVDRAESDRGGGVPEKEGCRKCPRTTRGAIRHVSLLDEGS